MDERNNGNDGQSAAAATSSVSAASSTSGSAIDIEKLAEKVYQLMRNDARLERARGKTPGRGTRDIRR